LRAWHTVELGPLLDGASVEQAVVRSLPPEQPMTHYLRSDR